MAWCEGVPGAVERTLTTVTTPTTLAFFRTRTRLDPDASRRGLPHLQTPHTTTDTSRPVLPLGAG